MEIFIKNNSLKNIHIICLIYNTIFSIGYQEDIKKIPDFFEIYLKFGDFGNCNTINEQKQSLKLDIILKLCYNINNIRYEIKLFYATREGGRIYEEFL